MKLSICIWLFAAFQAVHGLKGATKRDHYVQRRADEDDVKPKKRTCKIGQDVDKDGKVDEVEFKCKTKTTDSTQATEIEDEIKFKIKNVVEGLKVEVEYEQEVEDIATELETETKTKYAILFDRVIEYQKVGNSDVGEAYDWEKDFIVQEKSLALTNGMFTDISTSAVSMELTGSDVSTNEAGTSTFSFGDESVIFTFTINRANEGESVKANTMKIDFELMSFGWLEQDSYVALISTIESKRKIEIDYKDEGTGKKSKTTEDVMISFDDAINATGTVPFGEFTWAKDAVVLPTNDTEAAVVIDVIATSPADGNSIAFSFTGEAAKQAADIYWDPEAGIGYRTSAAGAFGKVASFACALAFGVFAFW